MRIIVICGNDECGQEYHAETNDFKWECPHCGRERENKFYPFLTARFMQARIDGDKADWKSLYSILKKKAVELIDDLDEKIGDLVKDHSNVEIPDRGPSKEELENGANKIDEKKWRERYEALLETARKAIITREKIVTRLENEIREKSMKIPGSDGD
jgi:hypothetical protein